MEKIAQEHFSQLLKDAATALRTVAAERDEALNKVAAMELHQDAAKLAHTMQSKGLTGDLSIDQITANLEKMAAEGKLDTVKAAVELVGPDMGDKLASLQSSDLTDDRPSASGTSLLEQFIISGS